VAIPTCTHGCLTAPHRAATGAALRHGESMTARGHEDLRLAIVHLGQSEAIDRNLHDSNSSLSIASGTRAHALTHPPWL